MLVNIRSWIKLRGVKCAALQPGVHTIKQMLSKQQDETNKLNGSLSSLKKKGKVAVFCLFFVNNRNNNIISASNYFLCKVVVE